ncbi:MAG: tRNA (N6-threonylcarbamoyladenosine(37)-N6)-methyltransferase TrmO [Chlamydiia bacterium]|nr:tRNA (N6-threonylcarbamoyladenosine(37)-N6)-methyltransferase TrmO [Chlamydiia bacterium]
MLEKFCFEPIGVFHSAAGERYHVPRQAGVADVPPGYIELAPHRNFEQALADLDGFDRVWLLYCFHRNPNWKPKVLPPRGGIKRGVFATRAPHRPNPIGLSCVELIRVDGLRLDIGAHDLLDGTPILDIKPYISYADAWPEASQGWLETLEAEEPWTLSWGGFGEQVDAVMRMTIQQRLSQDPYPYPSRRIRQLHDTLYEIAYKEWRVRYRVYPEQRRIEVEGVVNEGSTQRHKDRESEESF